MSYSSLLRLFEENSAVTSLDKFFLKLEISDKYVINISVITKRCKILFCRMAFLCFSRGSLLKQRCKRIVSRYRIPRL